MVSSFGRNNRTMVMIGREGRVMFMGIAVEGTIKRTKQLFFEVYRRRIT